MNSKSAAYKEGYAAYFLECDLLDNPYDYADYYDLWSNWYDGFQKAYCEDETK